VTAEDTCERHGRMNYVRFIIRPHRGYVTPPSAAVASSSATEGYVASRRAPGGLPSAGGLQMPPNSAPDALVDDALEILLNAVVVAELLENDADKGI
jgi:hypothetical protein